MTRKTKREKDYIDEVVLKPEQEREKAMEQATKGMEKAERRTESERETEELKKRYGGEDYIETVLDKEKEQEMLEEREAKRELGEAEREKLKKDLIAEIKEPIEKLMESEENIEKCDAKLEELQGKWFKGKQKKAIKSVKETVKNDKEKALESINQIEDEYIQKGFSSSEIRKLVQEKIREKKEEDREKLVGRVEIALEATKEAEEKEESAKEESAEGAKEKSNELSGVIKEVADRVSGDWKGDSKELEKIIKVVLGGEVKIKIELNDLKRFEEETGTSYKKTIKKGLTAFGRGSKFVGVLGMLWVGIITWYLGNTIEKTEKGVPRVK
jgi:uncharacterized protein YoaH (UPF0181 family)